MGLIDLLVGIKQGYIASGTNPINGIECPAGNSLKLGGKGASEYLLADGSRTMTGNLTVKKASGATVTSVGNDKADIQLRVNSDGSMGVYDATHAKWLTKVDANGVSSVDVASSTLTDRLKTNRIDATDGKTLIQYDAERNTIGAYTLPTRIRSSSETNLTHYISANKEYVILDSGNVGSYALPISGGTVNGLIKTTGGFYATRDVSGVTHEALLAVAGNGRAGLYHRTNNVNDAMLYLSPTELSYQPTVDGALKNYAVHHDGNSNKVLVSQTPLTAEGSVRVW